MAQPFHIAGAAAGPVFGRHSGGTNLIRDLFHKALSTMDLGRAEHALTIWNLVHSVTPNLIDLVYSVRHWIRVLFTSTVTVSDTDELHGHVLGWLEEKQLRNRFIREYTAQTSITVMAKRTPEYRSRLKHINYKPNFNVMWFFYRWNLIVVTRDTGRTSATESANSGYLGRYNMYYNHHQFDPVAHTMNKATRESVTITCLGWSTKPIRGFLEACHERAEAQTQNMVPVQRHQGGCWDVLVMKPFRPLDTIYLQDDVKKNLLDDIEKYLDPERRRFYNQNGIPYRRGYLLHGPPGCGKSSMSMALAGHFGLTLFVINCADVVGTLPRAG